MNATEAQQLKVCGLKYADCVALIISIKRQRAEIKRTNQRPISFNLEKRNWRSNHARSVVIHALMDLHKNCGNSQITEDRAGASVWKNLEVHSNKHTQRPRERRQLRK